MPSPTEQAQAANDHVLAAMQLLYSIEGSIAARTLADRLHMFQRLLADWIEIRLVREATKEKEASQ
jgi:hypothetical protein